jgi:site-specific DNA recombinase
MATGNYKKTAVLKIVTEDGLRTRKGRKLSAQTFEETLKKLVYCGYITSSCLDSPVKALHEPLVSESQFRAVQDVLNGKRLSIAPKRRNNPDFPLKCFVRCSACGTPVTGGFVTGKNKSHKFRYYWCRQPGCRAVFIRGEALEELFVEHLRALQPDEELVSDFLRTAEQTWKRRHGDAEANAVKLKYQLEEQKRMKSELLRAKLRGEVSQADYAQANAEFDAEASLLTEKMALLSTDQMSLDGFVRFGKAALADFAGAWGRANGDQKFGVQNLVFQGGLHYSPESRKFEHLNTHLFSVVAGMSSEYGGLASPTGFEPVLPP